MIIAKKPFFEAKTQYLAAISANLLLIGFGCGIGWFSVALPLLQSDDSPLDSGPIAVDDLSWIGSAISIGGIVGNFVVGFCVIFIGSKYSILFIGLVQVASWGFMMFGTNALRLCMSRFCTGFTAGGAQICMSLYIAEIADNNIRGQLGTIYQYFRNIGILFSYALGSYYTYVTSSMIYAVISILFFASFYFMPSTPQYLLQRNQIEAAEKSFKFYNKHKLQSDPKACSAQFEALKEVAKQVKKKSTVSLSDICLNRFAIFQAVVFSLLNVFSAHFIFLTYGTNIIAKSGTHLSPLLASVCMALVQLFATFMASILIDRKGRKFLLLLSMVGCTLSHGVMISYLYLYSTGVDTSMFHWTPALCMSSAIFMASIGIVPLTLISMVESFTVEVRSFGMTLGSFFVNLFTFIIIKVFPILEQMISLQGCLLICCVCCALGAMFTVFFVEETKGKELNIVDDKEQNKNNA